uniref:hypothetical protein n=1 Tax=Photorhabdus sp. RM322S TaxID=3342825 RepID=UPI0036DABE5D
MIRQTLQIEQALPSIKPGEWSQQQRVGAIGQNDEKTVGGALTEKITDIRRNVASVHEFGSSVPLGSNSINVLTLLIDILNVADELAKTTASHTQQYRRTFNSENLNAIAGKTRTVNKKYEGVH